MLAVRIHRYDSRDALSLDDLPVPDIGPDDLLAKVVAASVNPVDWKGARNGTYAGFAAVGSVACARKPRTIPHAEAASLPLGGITGWEALVEPLGAPPDDRLRHHPLPGRTGTGGRGVRYAGTP